MQTQSKRFRIEETHIDRSTRFVVDREVRKHWGDCGDVVLDFTSVRTIDAVGIALLLELKASLERADRNLILTEVQDSAYEMLMVSRVDRVLRVYLAGASENEEAA